MAPEETIPPMRYCGRVQIPLTPQQEDDHRQWERSHIVPAQPHLVSTTAEQAMPELVPTDGSNQT